MYLLQIITNLIKDPERFFHCIFHFALPFYMKSINQELEVLDSDTRKKQTS